MKIYISGQISGLEYKEAKYYFKQAELYLRWKYPEAKVINPLRWCLPSWMPWKVHMILDIAKLFTCTHIYLLGNWTDSRGASIEHFIAKEMGMEVLTLNEGER